MEVEMQPQDPDRSALQVKLRFAPSTLQLTRTPFGLVVELEGCRLSGEPGGPGLPSKIIQVALPTNTAVSEVTATAEIIVRLTDEPDLVAPLQPLRPGTASEPALPQEPKIRSLEEIPVKPSALQAQSEVFASPLPPSPFTPPRMELYEREIEAPRPFARLITTEQVGATPIAVIEVNPVRLAENGLLEFAPEIEVTIRYAEQEQPRFERMIHSRTQLDRIVEMTRARVINPDAVQGVAQYAAPQAAQVDYLVITDNQTWNEATLKATGSAGNLVQAFQRLVDWKAKRGLKSRVVTVNDIVSGVYGNFTSGVRDLQEVIRNFLKWALKEWGITWVLLGGDIHIVPVRQVAGGVEYNLWEINLQSTNPPPANTSFWTGTFLKINLVTVNWGPRPSINNRLVKPDTGELIPYDSAGTSSSTQAGWYFCTDNTYTTRTTSPTQFIRVNGPATLINARLRWLYEWNMLPTDLYYASLQGPNYNKPGFHDWDLNNNGIYGQHTDTKDFDGVDYETDISVGRVPVSSAAQAEAFVSKVIAYEQLRKPDGTALSADWLENMLIVSSNWDSRIGISPTSTNPPSDNCYCHPAGTQYSLIKLGKTPADLTQQLIAEVTPTDLRVLPYDRAAASGRRGWFYAKSASDLTPSESIVFFSGGSFYTPIPTQWIVVYGNAAELVPQSYMLDKAGPDGSMTDQERLRQQVYEELGIRRFLRLYEDEVDLTSDQVNAAPIQHLTQDRLRNALNKSPHFVSLSGHGNSNGCCWLSRDMARNLTNGYSSFIAYADSCLTNQFDTEDAVSEELLYNPNGGAVAYVGNTRFSWVGLGDEFQRTFFHQITATCHLGLLHDTRCTLLLNETKDREYIKWAIFTLNLMGDPEMPVRIPLTELA